jgi:DNA polymerase-1
MKKQPSPHQTTLPGMEESSPPLSGTPVPDSGGTEPNLSVSPAAPNRSPAGPPDTLAGKTVWVVDANSLIFQVFHAIPEMTSPAGQPVNAVFGFTRDVLFLLEAKKPDYFFCAFDRSEPTFRHELYENYKGTRSELPTDLAPQFGTIRRMLDALHVAVLDCPGYEADDILAMLAHQTDARGGECFLVTGDKDVRQLITDRVKVYNVRKHETFDAAALMAEWGVRPEQVVDFQSLVGDSVDNIPGVPLVGPKVAREWLEKFNSLDELLARADELPKGKRKDNLIASRELALLSRQLVRLSTEVPMEVDWNLGKVYDFVREPALELCREYGFRGLRDKIATIALPQDGNSPIPPAKNIAPPISPDEDVADVEMPPESATPTPPVSEVPWNANYKTIDTSEALAKFVAELSKQTLISFDTETTSLRAREAEIVGYSFAWTPGEAYYLPVRGPEGEQILDCAGTLAVLKPILENPNIRKLGQNLKYDMIVLRSAGVNVRGVDFDTIIASYLLEAGERSHNLDELALRYLGHTTTKITELIGTGKNQKRMDEVPIATIAHYAAEDADVPVRLQPLLAARLEELHLMPLFDDLEIPLIDVLVELEFNGICVDLERLTELSIRFNAKLAELEGQIYATAGREFNIASPKQLQVVLFDELKLPVGKKTKTGPSTDADVLADLAKLHPLPALIVEHRQYAKLKGTYVDALPAMVNSKTRRIHTSFNQVVAATGRLSSNDPNLQNIPIRTDVGREIRSAFIAGCEGWTLLAADYSQIELRVLAHFCGDATLCESFANDEDIHARVAAEVYGVPLAEVTSAQRRSAKAVNFGVIYGQSAFGLAQSLDIPKGEAAAFIDAYFQRYPGVDAFIAKTLDTCARQQYVSTILGRRRTIYGVRRAAERGANRQLNMGERTAVNTVIQGSAADIIKKAMIAVYHRLQREQRAAKMLLQIHDELMFEVPPDEVDAVRSLVVEEMTGAMELSVPLKVDVKTGRNWAECE